jgi:hypothetical protein
LPVRPSAAANEAFVDATLAIPSLLMDSIVPPAWAIALTPAPRSPAFRTTT